jgi:hypothetical protein
MFNLCKLGIHWPHWDYVTKAKYDSAKLAEMAIPIKRARRVCSNCGRAQEQEVHCLGLNPPKYTKHWFNIDDSKGYFKAKQARENAEKSNENLQEVLFKVRQASAKGEVSLWLHGYRESIGGYDLEVRKLLEGLGYGLNCSRSAGENLVIYW